MWGKPKEKKQPEMVPEFLTGIMLLKSEAIEKKARKEMYMSYGYNYGNYKGVIDTYVYLRKGSEPKWDYVYIPIYEEPKFWVKNKDTEVDINGKPITTKK